MLAVNVAASVTSVVLALLHVDAKSYPFAADAVHDSRLAGAFLFSSVAAGVGEEILLFAVPIVLVVVNLAGSVLAAVVMLMGYIRYWRGGQDGRRSRPAVAG
jgi:hypothetical protein